MKIRFPLRFLAALLPALPVVAGAFETADPAAVRGLAAQVEQELRGNILPWWLKNARDPVHGGFHAFIGEDMIVHDDQPRGALLTSRILWTFSAAYRKFHDPAYLEMARWAYRDQTEKFTDRENGGLFWTIRPDGRPLDAHKQIYGQIFGLYGLSEYYRATGEPAALDQAVAIYRLIENHAHDPLHGGYYDSLERDWRRPNSVRGNLLGAAPKSQNSHIHILEGLTNLLRVWPDPGLRQRQRELIELTLTRILDPRTHHLVLFMQDDWTPLGDAISYGHDIELSWLVVEAAEVLGDPALLARARMAAVAIARATNAEGIDADGGVFIEGNPRGPTRVEKEWWEQAEATVGFVNACQISGDPRFFTDALRSWRFIQEKFVDRAHGDWHYTLQRDGRPIPGAKLSIWKCPYHNSRACLELLERLPTLAGDPGVERENR